MGIPVFSVAETREIEQLADAQGYAFEAMMADAGRAVARQAAAILQGVAGPRVTVLVGPGNNGGDGLVAARLLTELLPGAQVRAYLLDRREGDSLLEAAQERGVFVSYAADDHDGRVAKHMSASADLVIDALFGIGARLPIRETPQRVLRYVRQALNERASARRAQPAIDPTAPGQIERPPKQFVLAVDCPSGVDCDTGAADSVALKADVTVTFIGAKPGLLAFPAAGLVGRLFVAPLQMPETINLDKRATVTLTDNDTARALLPARPLDGHKGTFGRVLLYAGSSRTPGAAGLSARAAYRTGAGLVEVAAPDDAIRVLQAGLLEAIWTPVPDAEGAQSADALAKLVARAADAKALVVGPGLVEPAQRALVTDLLRTMTRDYANVPVVVDADGLKALSAVDDWPALLPADSILTPHPGEMSRLSGLDMAELQRDRIAVATKYAAEWKVVLVLKGPHTVVAGPDGRVALAPFKTDALSKGGTGDVLAGLIGALRAQGVKAYDAAVLGVYIHGLAGVLAAEKIGATAGVLASEVADAIPAALGRISAG